MRLLLLLKKVDNRERQILYDFIYIWNLKKEMNKQNRVIDSENKQVVARGGVRRKEVDDTE